MNYLFWNTYNNKNINPILKEIIKEYKCDVVALAEYKADDEELLKDLQKDGINLYKVKQIACKRIHLFTKYIPEKINHLPDSTRYTIKEIPHDTLRSTIIAFIHLPSKLHSDNDTHKIQLAELKRDIEDVEKKLKQNNTVIVGDFNVNPFEEAVVSASGLHSINSKRDAKRYSRKIYERDYSMFYNPMWQLLGDKKLPAGSYYYNSSSYINYFWNIFDQVVIRPNLIENFNEEKLVIIDKVRDYNLLDKNNKPDKNISDHLPIFFEIK